MKKKILAYLLIGLGFLSVSVGNIFVNAAWSNGNSTYEDNFWPDDWQMSSDSSDEAYDGWELEGVVVTAEAWKETEKSNKSDCNGIKLNTNVPFIWNCISTDPQDKNSVTPTEAFPTFTQALIKIVMSVILVVCFILIIVSGIQYSMDKPKEAKALIVKVARVIGLLWLSGVILKLINPTFFS